MPVLFIGFSVWFSGCNPKESVPGEFPDEEEMAEILAELYIAESIITQGQGGSSVQASDEEIPGYYRDVLDAYDLTSSEFDTIRKWYSAHPYHYQEVYDLVIVYLSQKEAELNRQIKAEKEMQDSIPEIFDLWKLSRKLVVNENDTLDSRIPFKVELDSLKEGEIKLSAIYKFLRADVTREGLMLLITQYADSTRDTISLELEKTFQEKNVSVSQTIDSAKTATLVSGFLFDHDTSVVTSIEFSDIRLQHMLDNKPETMEKLQVQEN